MSNLQSLNILLFLNKKNHINMDKLGKLAEYFETYRGHDQVLSLLGYNFTMLSGLCPENSKKREKLVILANQIVNCRTLLRFLDDFSMLHYTLSYGLGKHVYLKLIISLIHLLIFLFFI
jgi:hypothetical protein